MSAPILETAQLTKQFGGLTAVDGVSAEFDEAELTSIVGPNGAGKTTYFNLITGALDPDEGRIRFKGEDITELSPVDISKRGLVRSYQIAQLFEGLSVIDNVKVGIRSNQSTFNMWRVDENIATTTERAESILEQVSLMEERETLASTLNHGARRALELAIAIGTDPDLLLLDEPLAGMNREETDEIVRVIRGINESIPIILVEHNVRVVMEISDRILVLHDGRKIADGLPEEIRADDRVREVYLGEVQ